MKQPLTRHYRDWDSCMSTGGRPHAPRTRKPMARSATWWRRTYPKPGVAGHGDKAGQPSWLSPVKQRPRGTTTPPTRLTPLRL